MTAIVVLEDDGGAWIGADSFYGSTEEVGLLHPDAPKVFENGPLIFAVSGSLRLAQILKYGLTVPPPNLGEEDGAFLFRLTGAIIEALRTHDHMGKISDGGETALPTGGASHVFMLYRGRAYCFSGCFSLSRAGLGYNASGSGWAFALGALAATPHVAAGKRIEGALEAAALHCPTVRAPFIVRYQPIPA